MGPILEIADLKNLARKRVPKLFFDYADSGSYTEGTYRANESDFSKIKLRQRVLVDMSGRTLETTMIGEKVKMPVACPRPASPACSTPMARCSPPRPRKNSACRSRSRR